MSPTRAPMGPYPPGFGDCRDRGRQRNRNAHRRKTRDIDVTPVNAPPVLADMEVLELVYTQGGAPVVITSAIRVADLDDTNIETATVQIAGNYQNPRSRA